MPLYLSMRQDRPLCSSFRPRYMNTNFSKDYVTMNGKVTCFVDHKAQLDIFCAFLSDLAIPMLTDRRASSNGLMMTIASNLDLT